MTLQQLLYFVTSVESGSFTKAAQELYLSTPSVADQVRRLEKELGVGLFRRGARTLELTDAGRVLLPLARQVLLSADRARRAVGQLSTLSGGVATFGLFRNSPYYLLAGLAADFLELHPAMQLRLVGRNSAEVADAVRDGRLEAGLVVLPIDGDGLVTRSIFRDEVRYVTAVGSRAGAPVSYQALAATHLILYDAGFAATDPTRRQLAAEMQRRGLTLTARVEVEHVDAALQLVKRGIGDTMLAGALQQTPAAAGLYSASFEEPLFDEVAVVARPDVVLSAPAAEFIRLAEAQVRQLAERVGTIELLGPLRADLLPGHPRA